MSFSFAETVISAALFGVIGHALLLGRYVTQREPASTTLTAVFIIFFSGIWYIGPFTYFGFKKRRPLLAQACLRQMVAVTLLVVALIAAYRFDANF